MLLYANGDSHSLGAIKGGGNVKSFVQYVAENFDLQIHNDSEGASSATRIIRTTKEYFTNNSTDNSFVLVGWGTWEREEWLYENIHYNVMVGWYKHLPEKLQERYNQWDKQQDYSLLVKKSRLVHQEIHDFHNWLMQQNIPHLFFNCMYDFQGVKTQDQVEWNSCYIGPYNNEQSYFWYLKNRKYEYDRWYHFPTEAHTEWGTVLIDHIKENKLI